MGDWNNSHTDRKLSASFTPDKNAQKPAETPGRVQKAHKDTLFRFIFRDKKKLLQLYNALNESDYQDENQLIVTTLENVIYLGYRNDLSFLLDGMMFLGEHQSTWNPNMCLRGILYFSRLYRTYVEENGYDIFSRSRIPLPFPQYTIFYNGTENRPERELLRMSDAFTLPEKLRGRSLFPAIECQALVLNINYGKNRRLMEGCRPLMEYAAFVYYIRENLAEGCDVSAAVDRAVARCLGEGILTDILSVHRKEVVELFLTDFDPAFHEKCVREEAVKDYKRLTELLLKDNRLEDMKRMVKDDTYCKELMEEYGI